MIIHQLIKEATDYTLSQHLVEGLFEVHAAQMGNSLKAQMEFKEQ